MGRAFANDDGLRKHIGLNKAGPCGMYALRIKRQKHKTVYMGRIIAIKQLRLTKLGILGKTPNQRKGPLKTREKEALIDHLEVGIHEHGYKQSKAIKETAKYLRRSQKLVRRVLKEKLHF